MTFQFLLQAAPNNAAFPNGEDLGTDRIRMRLRPDAEGGTFTADFAREVRDAGGTVVFTARGTVSGVRIRPEPIS